MVLASLIWMSYLDLRMSNLYSSHICFAESKKFFLPIIEIGPVFPRTRCLTTAHIDKSFAIQRLVLTNLKPDIFMNT